MGPFRELGIIPLASTLVGVLPLAMGIMYSLWPTEQRLTLVRTLSLTTVFAAVSGSMLGFLGELEYVARRQPGGLTPAVAAGLADSLVPLFFGFGCLTVAWLCVSIGLWRRAGQLTSSLVE
jgi:hypothetical protein